LTLGHWLQLAEAFAAARLPLFAIMAAAVASRIAPPGPASTPEENCCPQDTG
jgi:hypothetical protein